MTLDEIKKSIWYEVKHEEGIVSDSETLEDYDCPEEEFEYLYTIVDDKIQDELTIQGV